MAYEIRYSPDAREHMQAMSARDRRLALNSVEMRPNPLAPWELRIGNLRVYYDIEDESEPTVWIEAIGIKKGNVVYIGSEAVYL